MNKIQNLKFKVQKSSEEGVTLLLAILVLAGLTLITIAISTFAIQELRASRAVIVSEPAIAAAETGGEKGLWALKRTGTLANCNSPSAQTLTNNSVVNSCESFGKATFVVKGGVPYSFYLYDPASINGDIDLLSMAVPYNSLTISQIAGSNQVNVSVLRLDTTNTNIVPSSSVVAPGGTQTVTISAVAAGSEGRMKVTLTSVGDVTVEVNTNAGMPTFPTLDSTGCSSKTAVSSCSVNSQEVFTRRINITVPQ